MTAKGFLRIGFTIWGMTGSFLLLSLASPLFAQNDERQNAGPPINLAGHVPASEVVRFGDGTVKIEGGSKKNASGPELVHSVKGLMEEKGLMETGLESQKTGESEKNSSDDLNQTITSVLNEIWKGGPGSRFYLDPNVSIASRAPDQAGEDSPDTIDDGAFARPDTPVRAAFPGGGNQENKGSRRQDKGSGVSKSQSWTDYGTAGWTNTSFGSGRTFSEFSQLTGGVSQGTPTVGVGGGASPAPAAANPTMAGPPAGMPLPSANPASSPGPTASSSP